MSYARNIGLTEVLQSFGKRGHGLCGKDADLDYGGQIVVEDAGYVETPISCELYATIHPYASIVPAEQWMVEEHLHLAEDSEEANRTYERYMDYCTELACDCGYAGEWDGDYWVFTMGHPTITMPCPVTPVGITDDPDTVGWQKWAAGVLYDRIFSECSAFQNEMEDLAKAMECRNFFGEEGSDGN